MVSRPPVRIVTSGWKIGPPPTTSVGGLPVTAPMVTGTASAASVVLAPAGRTLTEKTLPALPGGATHVFEVAPSMLAQVSVSRLTSHYWYRKDVALWSLHVPVLAVNV